MKKVISIILVSAVMISLVACGAGKPEDVVTKYFSAVQKLDTYTMATCILPSTGNETTTAGNSTTNGNEFSKCFKDYIETNAKKLTFIIAGTEVDKKKAVVTVDCKYVDGSALYEAVMREFSIKYLARTFLGKELTDAETSQMLTDIMKEKISKTTETFKDVTLKINCVKQDGKWYISEVSDDMKNVISCNFEAYRNEIENGKATDSFTGIIDDVLSSVFDLFGGNF